MDDSAVFGDTTGTGVTGDATPMDGTMVASLSVRQNGLGDVEGRWRPLVALLSCAGGLALAWGLTLLYALMLGTTRPVDMSGEPTGPRGGLPWLFVAVVAAAAAGPLLGWFLLHDRRWLIASVILGGLAAVALVVITVVN